jgi:hypothetical protein
MKTKLQHVAILLALAALGGAATLAVVAPAAEIVRKPPLQVTFDGQITPRSLPRTGTAPVGVRMSGKIRTLDRSIPPKLERIILDINRNGKLQTKGLPRCALGKLQSISSAGARRACGDALIGNGSVTSRVSLPGQGAFASNGPMLAFNGRYKGKSAVFAQVATGAPLPLTYVIIFQVKKKGGTFGNSLVGTLPPIASEYGYITAFNLSLRRQYAFKGKRMSYASGSCPAPKGFPGAQFAFAKVRYEFADGAKLGATLVKECKVRR